MSVFISSAVWRTPIGNSTLKLILLALADMANDEGECWPSVRSICQRCELAESTVRAQLVKAEELGILKKRARTTESGRATSNLFEISAATLEMMRSATLREPEGRAGDPPGAGGIPSESRRGDPPGAGGGTLREMDPLKHHIETSDETKPEASQEPMLFDSEKDEPDFPIAQIRTTWNTYAPSLAKVLQIVGARARLTRARHRDLKTIADWKAFCERVEASDFLTGRANTGREWKASFDWCMIPANFVKICEGKYDNDDKPRTRTENEQWSKWS